jgi:hypothetical protein
LKQGRPGGKGWWWRPSANSDVPSTSSRYDARKQRAAGGAPWPVSRSRRRRSLDPAQGHRRSRRRSSRSRFAELPPLAPSLPMGLEGEPGTGSRRNTTAFLERKGARGLGYPSDPQHATVLDTKFQWVDPIGNYTSFYFLGFGSLGWPTGICTLTSKERALLMALPSLVQS